MRTLTLILRVPSVSIESHSSTSLCLGGVRLWLWIVFPLPDSHACGSVFGESISQPQISQIHTDESQLEPLLVALSEIDVDRLLEMILPRTSVSKTLRDCHVKSCSLGSPVLMQRGAVERQNRRAAESQPSC